MEEKTKEAEGNLNKSKKEEEEEYHNGTDAHAILSVTALGGMVTLHGRAGFSCCCWWRCICICI